MKNKKNLILIILGVVVLIVAVVGFTYAYFTAGVSTTGSGGTAEGTTTTLENTELKLEPLVGATNYEYPGGTGYTGTKVTATNKNSDDTTTHYMNFKLVLEYTNPTSTVLNYKLYESNIPVTGELDCNLSNETVDGAIQYSYNCTGLNYGAEISSGTLAANKTTTTSLTIPYVLNIANDSNSKYYYVVVDYPNTEENQSTDQGKKITYGIKETSDIRFRPSEARSDGTSSGMLATLRTLNPNIPASSGARTDFSNIISNGNYTYSAEDDLGVSYYFAGAVNTNWVKLGNDTSGYTYWRIVRINGNGSVRLIYSGTDSPTSSQSVVMTGEGTRLESKSTFNSAIDDNAYVGYMYGSMGATNWTDAHANTNNSTIKDVVDNWYSSNKSGFESYIDINAGFCGDRSASTSETGSSSLTGYGTNTAYYGGYLRLRNKGTPDLTCNKNNTVLYNNDLYTKSGASIGNKALSNPVGLITADEVILAGGLIGTNNTGHYLYTNQNYWTMTPSYHSGDYAYVWHVNSNGNFSYDRVNFSGGVRPVINLKSNLTWSGTGEWNSPFEVS